MKKIITLLLIALSNLCFAQSNVIEIDYSIDFFDPFSGDKNQTVYGEKIDWEFNVKFDSTTVKIWRKFMDDFYEERIINKPKEEVLLLKCEAENKYTFYTSTSSMLGMDMSSNYGDTTITITDEHKEILGYDCYKILMDFGGQANAELWVTDEIKAGVIVPETPMTLDKIALEYRFDNQTYVSEFKATHVKRVVETINDTSIPDDYFLNVPISVFDIDNVFEADSSEFDFVQYPNYSKGKAQLHEDIRELCSLTKKSEDLLVAFEMAFIQFKVKKDGSLTDIRIDGIRNKKEAAKVMKLLTNSIFIPAMVKGQKVNSSVLFTVSLNN